VRPMEEERLDSVDLEADAAVPDWKLALILAGDAAVDKLPALVSLLAVVCVAAVDYMGLVLLFVVDIAAVGGVVAEAVVDIPFASVLFGTVVVVDVAAAGGRSQSMFATAVVAAHAPVVYSRHASFHVVVAVAAAVEVYVIADALLELDLTGDTLVAGSHLVVVAVVGIAAAESVLQPAMSLALAVGAEGEIDWIQNTSDQDSKEQPIVMMVLVGRT
jgi:hypothetical protein